MDGHKDALTDEGLAREIESALTVEPSPQFVAKVRERVSREPNGAGSTASWRLWLGGAALVAGALAVFVSLAGRPSETDHPEATRSAATPVPIPPTTTAPSEAAAPAAPRERVAAAPLQRSARRAVVRSVPREQDTNEVALPQVLIPENEKLGFALLVAELRDTKHAAAVAEATRGLVTPGPPWLDVAPVTIEPLRDVGIAEGEAQ